MSTEQIQAGALLGIMCIAALAALAWIQIWRRKNHEIEWQANLDRELARWGHIHAVRSKIRDSLHFNKPFKTDL